MLDIKKLTQEISIILKELLGDKYKNNQSVVSKVKKIQEAFKKETDKFGELAKEISNKNQVFSKSKNNLSGSEIGYLNEI